MQVDPGRRTPSLGELADLGARLSVRVPPSPQHRPRRGQRPSHSPHDSPLKMQRQPPILVTGWRFGLIGGCFEQLAGFLAGHHKSFSTLRCRRSGRGLESRWRSLVPTRLGRVASAPNAAAIERRAREDPSNINGNSRSPNKPRGHSAVSGAPPHKARPTPRRALEALAWRPDGIDSQGATCEALPAPWTLVLG